jgi:serine/threonine protein kinase
MPSILTFAVLITLQVLVLYAAPIEVEAVSSSSTVIHWETAVGALLNDARYKIIRQLMRGSFGEIYIAMDTRDNTRTMVAVKVSRHTTDDDAESNLGMMEQEARIMQQYFCEKSDRRNGVVEVLDHFPCGNRQYCMVMELLACDLIQHSFDLQTRPVAARLRRIQKCV